MFLVLQIASTVGVLLFYEFTFVFYYLSLSCLDANLLHQAVSQKIFN